MKAVIMAGGFGTRIQPLTINLPKPMIPLINKPIMLHIIELLKKHGITDLVLLLYHQPMSIKSYFRDGSDFGVSITYITPLEDYGTAGAVKAAAQHLDEPFLIISGDLLTDFDLGKLVDFHQSNNARATMTLTRVADPLQFGVVITDTDHKVTKFLEKPGWGEVFSDTINTGIYLLDPEVLELIPEEENKDWSKDIFPMMLEQGMDLYGCLLDGYWQDIGNPQAYLEACRDVLTEKVDLELDEKREPRDDCRLHLGHDTFLAPPDRLQGTVVIGENSNILGPVRLSDCVIGRNCVIEEGVELQGAILWDNVYVKKGARVGNAVLCHNTGVGAKARIGDGAVIADESRVGDDAEVNKGILVWPRKEIEEGATVTTNVIWGEKWRKSIFEGAVVRGLSNMELTPEFAAKLGAAFGSTLPKDSVVLGGRDSCRASRMLKRSFVGGLLSTGISVRDCKMVPLPVMTYKMQTFGELGGVYFRQCPDDPATTEIIFFDDEGMEISSSTSKGIERLFFKENFRRAHYNEPGTILELPQLHDFYRDGFLRSLEQDRLRQDRPRVVIDLNHSPAAMILPALLGSLGFRMTELNSFIDSSRSEGTPNVENRTLEELSRIVVTLGAQAGFWISPSGDRLVAVDDTGRILSDLDMLGSLTALICRQYEKGSLALPVSSPTVVEELAQPAGLEVVRTRLDNRALLEKARRHGCRLSASTDGRFAIPLFQYHFDALFTVAYLLQLLSASDMSLSEVVGILPKKSYRHLKTPCPLDSKGRVMRKMTEAAADKDASFIDGVRIQFENKWVLILPDPYRPIVHVVAEAGDDETAYELARDYCSRVDNWKISALPNS
ncbi:MAG: mannose-1-phosphate guanyltransferase [Desulfuromonadales bacterium]